VKRTSLAIISLVCLLCLSGCFAFLKGKTTKTDASPQELFKAAEDAFQKKNYAEAVELFERLKSSQPDFEKITEVYQRIADGFFNLGQYEEAISRYLQFLELYPNHEERHRTRYMIGMCYFNRIKGVDWDASMVQRAEAAFKQVAEDADAGQWKAKAEEKYKECRKKLAEGELYKAKSYISTTQYKAAQIAAQRILDQYGGLGLDKEAQAILDKVKGKVKDK
jgi:outer membrane protein assembly factor BamD